MIDSIASVVVALIAVFFATSLAAAAGIGGGGLFLPLLLLIFRFGFNKCAHLSTFAVVGNALAQSAINVHRRHPVLTHRPLIFWEMVTLILPAQIAGSNIGVLLVAVVPESFLYLLGFLVLIFASVISFSKARHRYIEESKTSGDLQALLVRERAREGLEEAPPLELPRPWLRTLLLLWTGSLICAISAAVARRCSTAFAISFSLEFVPLGLGLGWALRRHLPAFSEETISALEGRDQRLPSSSLQLDFPTAQPHVARMDGFGQRTALSLVVVIGMLCSLLGIGGGELLSPMLLWLGLTPQVTSATTATLSALNSLSLALQLAASGNGHLPLALPLFAVGLIGGYCGRRLGLHIAKTHASAIILALACVLFLSSFYYLYVLVAQDFNLSIKGLCND